MKVLKFGGTSIGSAERIKNVANIIANGERKIVVLSAMSKTTNALYEISNYLSKNNIDGSIETINGLKQKYIQVMDELFSTESFKQKCTDVIFTHFDLLNQLSQEAFTPMLEKTIVAQGEFLSTHLMYYYLLENKKEVTLCSALDFMRIDKNNEPDTPYIKKNFLEIFQSQPTTEIILTQGFVCRNAYGEIDNLERGGSDYTASILGGIVSAEEIQIWTDIDGMHNNDPRLIANTSPVRHLNFEEAAELAYFGAKILHPTCILPAKINNIPVRLLNTLQANAIGTLISNDIEKGKIKAVATKDNITSIRIKSGRMLLAYGFLRKVFEIFEIYRTPIDMITTSEVAVAVTIDNQKFLPEIVDDLKQYGTITIETDLSIICVVGDLQYNNIGFEAKIVNAIKEIPVKMISYGGSNYNISFLVESKHKLQALNALSSNLFV
jgi:aspartate kinase